MDKHRIFANTVSLAVGAFMGLAAFYAYYQYLSAPRPFTAEDFQGPLVDWAIDIGAGLTVGIIFFFVAWGHFQKITPADQTEAPTGETKIS